VDTVVYHFGEEQLSSLSEKPTYTISPELHIPHLHLAHKTSIATFHPTDTQQEQIKFCSLLLARQHNQIFWETFQNTEVFQQTASAKTTEEKRILTGEPFLISFSLCFHTLLLKFS